MKKIAFFILFTGMYSLNLVNAQSDSVLLLNELKIKNKLELKISSIAYGNWRGISNSGVMNGSNFYGWKALLEIRNISDSLVKFKIPLKLVDSTSLFTLRNDDARFIAVDYLKKYSNVYETNSMAKEYTGIISSYTTGKKNVVLNLIVSANGFFLEFFSADQKIIAKLNPDFELEVYPNSALNIALFYNENSKIKQPVGLIIK